MNSGVNYRGGIIPAQEPSIVGNTNLEGRATRLTCPTNSVAANTTTNHITTSGYSYDANGNMTNDGQNTLTYDAENRLLTSSGTLGSGTYTYDGKGRRVKRVSGSTTTVYIYSGSNIVAEYVNGAAPSSPTNEYFYAGDNKIASVESGSTYYYHNDRHSPRMRTNSSGTIQDQRGTFPFGETWYTTSLGPEWMFTNYQRDNESGNDYAYAREYVNRLGRFATGDPVQTKRSDAPRKFNLYSYVANDPINVTDPTGRLAAYCEEEPSSRSMYDVIWDPEFDPGPTFDDSLTPLDIDDLRWRFCVLTLNPEPSPPQPISITCTPFAGNVPLFGVCKYGCITTKIVPPSVGIAFFGTRRLTRDCGFLVDKVCPAVVNGTIPSSEGFEAVKIISCYMTKPN